MPPTCSFLSVISSPLTFELTSTVRTVFWHLLNLNIFPRPYPITQYPIAPLKLRVVRF
ncbi:AGAP009238-PA [Anopheles gambiae str. PEST]|uniref:AGAP009238-PA n=1 Tax=Anopheles gambiae TaxID=7165 RepID=A0NG82_ANOGA|nr:AGAP009238-PA [Anopheles gambiae str. PEST]